MIIKGSVELRLINKDTLNVEQTLTQENTITQNLRSQTATHATSNSRYGYYPIGPYVIISENADDSVYDHWYIRNPITGFVAVGETAVQTFDATLTTPTYTEFRYRFNPPSVGSTRSVNTVGISSTVSMLADNTLPVTAYVKLTAPCIQTDSQLLDVVYRIHWLQEPLNVTGLNTSDYLHLSRVKNLVVGSYNDYIAPYAMHHSPLPNLNDVTSTANSLTFLASNGADSINFSATGTSTTHTLVNAYPLCKRLYSGSATTSADVGKIYGSEYYTSLTTTVAGNTVFGWKNITPPTGYYIQPIHGHAASTFTAATPTPFLDVSQPTGTGKLVGGGSWTNPDYPELYLVKITATGNAGTATYQFWKRNHLGFNGTTYNCRHAQIGSLSSKYVPAGANDAIQFPPLKGSHGVLTHYNISLPASGGEGIKHVTYDYTRVVTVDNTGITLLTLPTSLGVNYDATTTPALPVTLIKQVSVNKTTGDIWVACANTGLWKVDVLGNAVTHFTVATHGVPSEMCYGVDIGRNNTIWAVFNGGLASSADGGTSWTVFNAGTVPAFNFVGVSDNNWNTVNYLKVDPTDIDDKMLIVRHPSAVGSAAVWWSRASATATGYTPSWTPLSIARANPGYIDVSDNESFWVAAAPGFAPIKLTYGTTSTITSITTTATYVPGVAFDKGPSGQDCFIRVAGASSPFTVAMHDVNLTAIISQTVNTGGTFVSSSPYNPIALYLGKGLMATVRYDNTTSSAAYGWTLAQILDSNNPMTGPFSYLMWDKYGWNGTNWELNHVGSKLVHTGSEVLTNGVTLAFQNGSGTSFVSGEYYTFGVVKGLLKDNTTSYSTVLETYWGPVRVGTTFSGTVRQYPSVGPVTWKRKSSSLTVNPDNSLVNKSMTRTYPMYAYSNNRVFGDFSITGTISPGAANKTICIGLSTSRGGGYTTGLPYWHNDNDIENDVGFRMSGNSFQPEVAGVPSGTATTITVASTTWEIRRVGTTITFYVNGVLKHTVTGNSVHSYVIRVLYSIASPSSDALNTVEPIVVASSGVGYYTEAGSSASGTGIFDPKFLSVDDSPSAKAAFQMFLDGVPVSYVLQRATTSPGPGEVNVIGEHGDFLFNAADVGKTVTGTYRYTTE